MSYMEFWARVYLSNAREWDAETACKEADAALAAFKERFPVESEAYAVAQEMRRRRAAGDVPEWAE